MSVIGENIRALRMKRHLTQQALAEIAGVSRETVVKWESGNIAAVRESNLRPIREAFNLSDDDLRSETQGLAAQLEQLEAGEDPILPRNDSLLSLRTMSNLAAKRPDDALVEVPASVVQQHPCAFVVQVDNNHVNNVMPSGCHAVVDPEMPCEQGAVALVQFADGTPGFWRVSPGRKKIMLTPDESSMQEDDELYDADELRIVGVVVWWQRAMPAMG